MPTVVQISQSRSQRRKRIHSNPLGKVALLCAITISFGLALASIFAAVYYSDLIEDLPSIEALPILLEPPDGLLLQPTRLFDRSGEHLLLSLENPDAATRNYLRLTPDSLTFPSEARQGSIPSSLVMATIAAVDPTLWNHPGFSLQGIQSDDHPTIAQRLASDLLLQNEPPGIRRALRERILASQITAHFGREKVVEWYLNSAYYGRLAYGADSASRLYFNKPAWELTLGEAAMLAGVADEPSINPIDTPQSAFERQKLVIQKLLQYRMVSPMDGAQAAQEELTLRASDRFGRALAITDLEPKIAPAFANLVLDQLERHISREAIERGGLRIYTTLDYNLQEQSTCAIETQLERLQPSHLSEGEQTCEAARLLPTLPSEPSISASPLQAEAVILDPLSGHILVMVGEQTSGLETTPLKDHPPGSLVTPFIYLTAFTRGFSPATLVWDIPLNEFGDQVQNFDGKFHGPVRLRNSLANDYLAPAESVLNQVGIENVWHTADQLGIQFPQTHISPGSSSLSIFREVNLLEISQAFGILANQGVLAGHAMDSENGPNGAAIDRQLTAPLEPISVLYVEDISGKVSLDWRDTQVRPIISPQLAYLMTDVLRDEGARWPSLGHPNELEIGRPAAAKFSRTLMWGSNWAVGYTPQLVLSVWLGQDVTEPGTVDINPRLFQRATAGLWHAIIQFSSRGRPIQDWTLPAGISVVQVCDPSGMLPTEDCPNVVDEIFLAGNEPLHADPLYRTLRVDSESGNLATIFTPLDQVEERPYFIVPNEASRWASQAGLDIPPKDYDAIPDQISPWPGVEIDSPTMFETIRGKVPIIGTSSVDDFDSYRIQVGEGLNPQVWYQVGEDQSESIQNDKLGEWDTSELTGLYAIQLVVVGQNQSAYRHTVLVTVDNTPPVVQINYPQRAEVIDTSQGKTVVFQADINDDLGVKSVDFYIEEDLLGTLTQPPFAISWKATPGTYSLVVEARDQAGNVSEDSVTFVVK